MAVVNTKSNGITNADANPPVISNRTIINALGYQVTSIVSVAAGDDDGSVYRLIRLPSRAVVNKIDLLNTAITAGTVYHCGVYNTDKNGGAVVSVDLFANTVSMATARTAPLDLRHFTDPIANGEKQIWQLLGLDTDPNIDYDLCLTGATVGTADGVLKNVIYWAQNGN